MSLLGECRDINGLAVKHGLMYMAGPGECHQCVCESGVPKNCQDVMCHQPQNCSTFRKGARCCDFVCLDDIPSGKTDVVSLEGDFGLRLIASVVTAFLSFSLLFFLVHRLRQRKIRSGRQNRQLSEDERSLGSIGYITGSLGYLPGAMERYEEPTAHFPHYPLWKPPGNYFPRGEAPPPYEEAVAATRAEALAAAIASGNLHANHANFGRDTLLGVNYNTYTTGSLLGGAAHRTIPINLATSASFTLQPERFNENPTTGGSSCVSVAAGTVSVTATVTAPQLARPDLLNSEFSHIRQGTDSSSRSNTLRRSDVTPRGDVIHRSDPSHRQEVGRRIENSHRSDGLQWSEPTHRIDAGLQSDGVHRAESGHRSDTCHRPESGPRSDACHRIDAGHQMDNISAADSNQRTESNHVSDVLQNDGMPLRKESHHHMEAPHNIMQSNLNDRSNHRSDSHHRNDFFHRDVGHREGLWRQETNDSMNFQRGDERRLPSMPLSENSHSLPPHHSHGMHHSAHSIGQAHHHPISMHSRSYGRHHQTPIPLLDLPGPFHAQDSEQKDIKPGTSKINIPQLSNIPKSGTGVYEDAFHAPSVDVPQTATLRRGRHPSVVNNGMITLRKNPVPVAAPTLSSSPKPTASMPNDMLPDASAVSSACSVPPPAKPSTDQSQSNIGTANSSPANAVVAAIVAASPPRCTCVKAATPRCTCPRSCHSSILSLAVNDSFPQNSNLSLTQAGLDDNDDYRSECENCKSTHSSNYYLDAEDPEPEITMTLHRKPAETGEENGNGYYRTSLTLPTRHRVMPLQGVGARDNWFSSMPESSSDDESEEEQIS